MRFDLLGGNYFHALSRSDLLKGWTTITLQSFSVLFCFVFFSFSSLSPQCFLFALLFSQEQRGTSMKATNCPSITPFNKFNISDKRFSSPRVAQRTLRPHTRCQIPKPLSKLDTSLHTLSYKKKKKNPDSNM